MLTCAPVTYGQLDRIYPHKGNVVSGVVKAITRDEVSVQVGSNVQPIPSNTIRRIIFEGDPAQLSSGRNSILDGQFEAGLAEIQRTDVSKLVRDESKADYMFYLAFATSKQALAGRDDLNKSVKLMREFVGKYPQSWHFYEAAQALGDLAMALNSPDAAKYYSALSLSPFPEYKLKAAYLEGLAWQKAGSPDKAAEKFNLVAGAQIQSVEGVRFQKLSKIGLAMALAQGNKAEEAVKELGPLIEQNDPADLEVSARLYNAHGFALLKKQDTEGAALAFLHTDLLFSAVPDAHVESLKHLIELWNKLGQPDRAAATRSRLEQLYPGTKI